MADIKLGLGFGGLGFKLRVLLIGLYKHSHILRLFGPKTIYIRLLGYFEPQHSAGRRYLKP